MWQLVISTSTMPKKYSFHGLSAPNAPSSAHIPSLSPAHAVEREHRYSLRRRHRPKFWHRVLVWDQNRISLLSTDILANISIHIKRSTASSNADPYVSWAGSCWPRYAPASHRSWGSTIPALSRFVCVPALCPFGTTRVYGPLTWARLAFFSMTHTVLRSFSPHPPLAKIWTVVNAPFFDDIRDRRPSKLRKSCRRLRHSTRARVALGMGGWATTTNRQLSRAVAARSCGGRNP